MSATNSVQSPLALNQLAPIADQIVKQAQSINGLADVSSSYSEGRPELQFHLRNSLAGDVNLTENDIATSIRALVTGDSATTWQQNGDDIPVVVRLPPAGQLPQWLQG